MSSRRRSSCFSFLLLHRRHRLVFEELGFVRGFDWNRGEKLGQGPRFCPLKGSRWALGRHASREIPYRVQIPTFPLNFQQILGHVDPWLAPPSYSFHVWPPYWLTTLLLLSFHFLNFRLILELRLGSQRWVSTASRDSRQPSFNFLNFRLILEMRLGSRWWVSTASRDSREPRLEIQLGV